MMHMQSDKIQHMWLRQLVSAGDLCLMAFLPEQLQALRSHGYVICAYTACKLLMLWQPY